MKERPKIEARQCDLCISACPKLACQIWNLWSVEGDSCVQSPGGKTDSCEIRISVCVAGTKESDSDSSWTHSRQFTRSSSTQTGDSDLSNLGLLPNIWTKVNLRMKPSSVIVVENGASTIKAGTLGGDFEPRWVTNYLWMGAWTRVFEGLFQMQSCVPREIRCHTLGMRLNGVGTIPLCITDYRSRRLVLANIHFEYRAGENISSATQGYLVDWDAQKAVWDGIFSDVLEVCLFTPRGHEFASRTDRLTRANHHS
jgi:hypothetical protein